MPAQSSQDQNQVFPIRHRAEEWIFRRRIGKLFWSILPPSQCISPRSCSLPLLSLLTSLLILVPIPLTPHFYLFCWYLTRQDFVFPGIPSFHLLERRAKRGWGIESLWRKVFGGRFWIMFTRHKLLTVWTWHVVNEIYFHDDYFYTPTIREPTAQYHRRKKKKKVFLPIRYTLCNILAVNTNKAMREKIMTRYQPFSGVTNSHSGLTKCPVELSSVSAPNLRLRTSPDRMLSTAQCCGKCNIWWLSEIQRVGQVRCCS